MVKLKAAALASLPVVSLLLVWQLFSLLGFFNPQFLPSPISVGRDLVDSFTNQNLLGDIFASLRRVIIGFLIAAALGVGLGLFAGVNRAARNFIMPLAELFRPVPPIAWIPLAILWFGLGDKPAYFLVFLGAFFPIFTNTVFGAMNLEETYKRAAYSLGAGKKSFLIDILIPASLPHIFAGMRIGLGVGWMAVITSELVGSQSGLGYMIQLNRFLLNTPKVVVGMVVIGVIGFSLNKLMTRAERALAPWEKL
jgi:ABC-type nitrate/sulfonate/bicarbonate transport system permease component